MYVRQRHSQAKNPRANAPKSWTLRWELARGDGGKRNYEYETFRGTQRDAESRWTKRAAELQGGSFVKPTKETVKEYLESWIATYGDRLKPTTRNSYADIIRLHVVPRIGGEALADLQPAHLRRLYTALLAEGGRADGKPGGLFRRSVRYVHSILHRALRQAVREEKLSRNVADLVEAPARKSEETRDVKAYTAEEARAISRAVAGHRLEALFLVAWQLGLRRGELLGLRWQDVDLDRGVLRVVQELTEDRRAKHLMFGTPKSPKSRRTLHLTTECRQALLRHQERQALERTATGPEWEDSGLVFCTSRGTPIIPRNLNRDWYGLRKKAGVPAYRFHSLRHTAATLMLAAGVPLPVVSETLGHESYSFTKDVYGHLVPEMQMQATTAMDAYLREHPQEGGPVDASLGAPGNGSPPRRVARFVARTRG